MGCGWVRRRRRHGCLPCEAAVATAVDGGCSRRAFSATAAAVAPSAAAASAASKPAWLLAAGDTESLKQSMSAVGSGHSAGGVARRWRRLANANAVGSSGCAVAAGAAWPGRFLVLRACAGRGRGPRRCCGLRSGHERRKRRCPQAKTSPQRLSAAQVSLGPRIRPDSGGWRS